MTHWQPNIVKFDGVHGFLEQMELPAEARKKGSSLAIHNDTNCIWRVLTVAGYICDF